MSKINILTGVFGVSFVIYIHSVHNGWHWIGLISIFLLGYSFGAIIKKLALISNIKIRIHDYRTESGRHIPRNRKTRTKNGSKTKKH